MLRPHPTTLVMAGPDGVQQTGETGKRRATSLIYFILNMGTYYCSLIGNFSLDFHSGLDYIWHMTVIGKEIISKAILKYADARSRLQSWFAETMIAKWENAQDIKSRYPSASFIGDDTVIFNIGGNKYRLVTRISYSFSQVRIMWFGTHAEYSRKKF